MAKGKNMANQGKNPKCFTRDDFEIRPVEKSDTWCKFQEVKDAGNDPEAPYGWIMMIPNYRKEMTIKPCGYVIRSKIFKGTLMLQIVKGKGGNGRVYGTKVEQLPREKNRSNKKRNKRRYLNIRLCE